MRIFVSHAWEDKPVAIALARLPAFVDAWVDVRELRGGQDLDPTIIAAIEDSHVFLTLVSRVSITKPYVNKELAWALEREARKDRSFVLPVMLEPGITLATVDSPAFRQLEGRLFLSALQHDDTGLEAARSSIAGTLFHWASDWLERFEPRGDHERRFVEALEAELIGYRVRLFAVKAVMARPLTTLVMEDAIAQLVRAKDDYNAYTDHLPQRLACMDEELRWRFGGPAQRGFKRLRDFIVDEVFQGTAFALNEVIESINAWEAALAHDPGAAEQAESRRARRIRDLEPVLDELVERTTDFVQTLKS